MNLSNGRSWSNERLNYISKSLPKFEHAINVSGNLDSDKQGGVYRDYFQAESYEISSYPEDKVYSNPSMDIIIDLDADISQISKECFQKFDLVIQTWHENLVPTFLRRNPDLIHALGELFRRIAKHLHQEDHL